MNLSTHTARLSIIWRRQRSSGHMFLSLDQAVPQRFFTLSHASRWGGIVGFTNSGMGKSRWYGIGSLMWRSSISISSELLTMQRQQSSMKRTSSRCGGKILISILALCPPNTRKKGQIGLPSSIPGPRGSWKFRWYTRWCMRGALFFILSRNSQYSDACIPSAVHCVRFSTDGKYLATGCDRTAQIYDTKTGQKTWLAILYTLVIVSANKEVFQCTRRRYCRESRWPIYPECLFQPRW